MINRASTRPRPRHRRAVAICAAATLAVASCGDDEDGGAIPDPAQDATTTTAVDDADTTDPATTSPADPTTTTDPATDVTQPDGEQASLAIAIRATVDQGTAAYTMWATQRSLDEIGSATGGPPGDRDSDTIEGRVDF